MFLFIILACIWFVCWIIWGTNLIIVYFSFKALLLYLLMIFICVLSVVNIYKYLYKKNMRLLDVLLIIFCFVSVNLSSIILFLLSIQ